MFDNIDPLSAVVASVSLALSLVVMLRQTRMQSESLKAQLESDVLNWAHEAIDCLAEGGAVARGRGLTLRGEEFARAQAGVAQRLSALADRGRLFFPNEIPDKYGAANVGAFQGVRPPILDAMVFACCRLEQMSVEGGPDLEAAQFLIDCRRLVVTEAQNAIDPRRRRAILSRLAEGRKDDATPSEQAVSELHAQLTAAHPHAPVAKAWAQSREFMRGGQGTQAG
ncbi:MAG: hypothetical protein KF700_07995 [Hyphomonadaceae bacterium]|nr:hypothetical protein [Hyphomonadaceae bacterium]